MSANPPTARELIEAAKAGKPTVVTRVWSLEREALRDRAEASFALALELAENVDKFDGTKKHLVHIKELARRALAAMDGQSRIET